MQNMADLGAKLLRNALQVVATKRRKAFGYACNKVAHCSRWGGSLKLGVGKYIARGHTARRFNHHHRLFGHQQWGEALAYPFYPRRLAAQKKRHIGTQAGPNGLQFAALEAELPQMIKAYQAG